MGEWWSILILRDAFAGLTRFDEFQDSLGIAPNMLTRRLNALVEDGLLERRRYSERPPRDEYVLTERGRDFRPVLLAMMAWGNRHFAPKAPACRSSRPHRRAGRPRAGRPRHRPADRRPRSRPRPGFASPPAPPPREATRRRLARHAAPEAAKDAS